MTNNQFCVLNSVFFNDQGFVLRCLVREVHGRQSTAIRVRLDRTAYFQFAVGKNALTPQLPRTVDRRLWTFVTFSNMNFLAHLYLSGDNPRLMVGNFIGDFVKGRNAVEKFDPEIARGIQLHRSIDEFTDTHPVVTQSKNRLRPKYRHYAGVIVDVFYDHFLASNWSQYHTEPLPSYAARVYQLIHGFDPILPGDVKYMLPYMVSGNWLVNYAQLEGIHRALSGMAKRTPFTSKMEEAVHDLKTNFNDFKKEFDTFFPELSDYCKQKISGER